jgi:hypothetical protein
MIKTIVASRNLINETKNVFFSLACNTFTDCTSCLANRGKRYNCSWCDDIQKCSDGYDRSRHQWIQAQCHRLASQSTCPKLFDDPFEDHHFLSSPSAVRLDNSRPYVSSHQQQHSALYTFRTIVVTLLITVLILSLIAFLGSYIYAYRHPTSPPGMWLIEHRPSNYIARFKRFTTTNNDSS